MKQKFKQGDQVIYVATKTSVRPGPRAKNICSAPYGDTYNYFVHKFWRVKSVDEDGHLTLVTRTGKNRFCSSNDMHLKKPGFWTRLRYHSRFPK